MYLNTRANHAWGIRFGSGAICFRMFCNQPLNLLSDFHLLESSKLYLSFDHIEYSRPRAGLAPRLMGLFHFCSLGIVQWDTGDNASQFQLA